MKRATNIFAIMGMSALGIALFLVTVPKKLLLWEQITTTEYTESGTRLPDETTWNLVWPVPQSIYGCIKLRDKVVENTKKYYEEKQRKIPDLLIGEGVGIPVIVRYPSGGYKIYRFYCVSTTADPRGKK